MSEASVLLRQPTVSDSRVIHNKPKVTPGLRTPVPGRTCGTCTLCCKLYPVPVMEKPAHVWCRECKPGRGCGIWETRPQFCRDFHCHYILDPQVGDDWKPEVCKFIMNFQTASTMWIKVDPAHKTAWKKEPYYSVLKRWSADFIDAGGHLLVDDGLAAYCITPAEDVEVSRNGRKVDFHVKTTKIGLTAIYEVVVRQLD